MKNLAWVAAILLAVVGVVLAQDLGSTRGDAVSEFVFFFSETSPDLATSARALRELRRKHPSLPIRPVFLAADFGSLARPRAEFAAGIRELKAAVGEDFSVHVYDEEGLALARDLGLDRLPAYALILTHGEGRRAFVAHGTRANLEELLRCGR